jgi:hypothetical protein
MINPIRTPSQYHASAAAHHDTAAHRHALARGLFLAVEAVTDPKSREAVQTAYDEASSEAEVASQNASECTEDAIGVAEDAGLPFFEEAAAQADIAERFALEGKHAEAEAAHRQAALVHRHGVDPHDDGREF